MAKNTVFTTLFRKPAITMFTRFVALGTRRKGFCRASYLLFCCPKHQYRPSFHHAPGSAAVGASPLITCLIAGQGKRTNGSNIIKL